MTSLQHGHSRRAEQGGPTPEYRAWDAMKQRCLNPSHASYADYGGRGITVCLRWLDSFPNFLADMGEKPEPKHQYSLERRNNDLGYGPENCYWATWPEQARNRRPPPGPAGTATLNLRGVSEATHERLRLAAYAENISVAAMARKVLDAFRPTVANMTPAATEELAELARVHASMLGTLGDGDR